MNKIKYGLRNVHYAMMLVAEDGKVTFGAPKRILGGVSMSLSPVGETTPFYADDMEYFTAIANNGYDGTLEVALLPESFLTDALGETISTTDKVITENANAQPSPFALLFEFTGDKKGIRHVIYNCKAARPSIESGTKESSITPKTDTLTLTVRPLEDGVVKRKTSAETTQSVYDAWYESVYTGEVSGA